MRNNRIVGSLKKICLMSLLVVVMFRCSSDREDIVYSDQALVHFAFDGNFVNTANNGNAGIPSGGVSFVEDRNGNPMKAVNFDGIESRVEFQNPLRESSEVYSISGWFKPNEPFKGNLVVVMRQSTVSNIRITRTDSLRSNVCFDNYINSGWKENCHEIDSSEWFHIVGVYQKDGRTLLYINGQLVNTQSVNASNGVSPDFTIKSHLGAIIREDVREEPNTFWNGAIDDFKIYEKALTQEEVLELYNDNN